MASSCPFNPTAVNPSEVIGNGTDTTEGTTSSEILLNSITVTVEEPAVAPILGAMVAHISLAQQQAFSHSMPLFASLETTNSPLAKEWSPYNTNGTTTNNNTSTNDHLTETNQSSSSTTLQNNTNTFSKIVSPFRQIVTASLNILKQAIQSPQVLGCAVRMLNTYGLHKTPQMGAKVSFFTLSVPLIASAVISKSLQDKLQQQTALKDQNTAFTKRPMSTPSSQQETSSTNPSAFAHSWGIPLPTSENEQDTLAHLLPKDKLKEDREDQQQKQNDSESQDQKDDTEDLDISVTTTATTKTSNTMFSENYNSEKNTSNAAVNLDESIPPNLIYQYTPSLLDNIENLLLFGLEASILSQIIKLRTSHFDVLLLFLEVLKISLKNRHQERLCRIQERLLQVEHMQAVVKSFKGQGKSLLMAGVSAGVMAIFSGVSPIIGQIKGDWIVGQIGRLFSRMKDVDSAAFFDQVSKVTLSMSEMSKATGQIQTAFAESHRAFDQHMQELYKIEADERTRNIEEIKENWRGLENFIYQSLQMYHDTSRQSYQ
ncbi:hypothetical protein CLAVI_000026 [Candidatus Clavichlamydia salmonicola]|uniref:hypothetical protein n=1 Tax=Candidatus Clavichlamydia salmonicola TaxID=469812 RepID=UPI0018910409|nr:hypothetical protein [Candidatus Clavichlamydia salmonicola]MBF5050424.1 hypothetical protein [Candidatus Clavichlamydia salmonicola]